MVFDGIIISFIVGFLRKGNLRALAQLKLKWGWIFPLLLVVELAVFILQNDSKFLGQVSGYIYIVVYVLGLLFLFINRKNAGFNLILLGVFLNFLVMVTNGGRMPVSLDAASILPAGYLDVFKEQLYAKHTALTESTKLGILGDIIPITDPYPRTQIISIGDIIMNIGAFLFIQYLMLKHPAAKNRHERSLSIKGGETK
ncbi:DUF5317 domain-containing protein [Bacillus sp. ISL-40]|uniref:DUF5317 domain-containing protein n=1 Tax=unclassified Bacillus (in: firmicutes) TaxID=185979 RepID=UPI001BEB1EFE|nr:MULTISPECIES: DUF5317 domain-containing protein [unclassified Bacillus (in: firmicutes)]MBT2695984.1 DUF5317 domain-containing protein [Bacillus sp. ISL-40]MBT2719518.1 DUF5317 domain-containing protein [Bacillus sp. ISL-46]MBT2739660.1 DUF5317 domain-containing protein [Bacillus sp. ISL-77]